MRERNYNFVPKLCLTDCLYLIALISKNYKIYLWKMIFNEIYQYFYSYLD